ncbi:MAG: hypothetical protein D6679_06310 [Candidatus Hydrogenedentota bacterium]|nr:MAG: hypothetical protein D6679_06310 [Candidatus Hydrogenedentota bacterium]
MKRPKAKSLRNRNSLREKIVTPRRKTTRSSPSPKHLRYSFEGNGEEFVFHGRPKVPWSHVLTNGRFGSVWTDQGGAFAWCGNSVLDRITRWEQDLVLNRAWRTVYIVDGSGTIRSLTPSPAGEEAEWTIRYAPGIARYIGRYDRYTTSLEVIVLPDLNAEVWYASVAFHRPPNGNKTLRFFSAQDILLGSWPDTHREFHRLFIECGLSKGRGRPDVLTFSKKIHPAPGVSEPWNESYPGVAAHAARPKPAGFETDRRRFYGYAGSFKQPAALLEPPRKGLLGPWGDAMAGWDVPRRVGRDGKVSAVFVTTFGRKERSAVHTAVKALRVPQAAAEESVRRFWIRELGEGSAETPSADLNPMISIWLRLQAIASRLYGRCALYQASGAIGYRDQLQDSLVLLPAAPERTLEQIRIHLEHQFSAGDSLHWWHPKTNSGPRDNCSDDYLWPILAAGEYFRETGDPRFLDRKCPFLDAGPAPYWDHLRRAIDRAWRNRSPRGLPLMGSCDWNDGLSSAGDEGRGESAWVAHFLHFLLKEMALLAEAREENPEEFLGRARELYRLVNRYAWDGAWYIQGTTDGGAPIGSHRCREGKIHLNPQTWSLISGTGRGAYAERGEQALCSVEKHLLVDWGVLLLAPAYSRPDPTIGYLTRYAPGRRENGGVYTHAAVWAARAARIAGKADLCRRILFSLLPPVRGRDPRYEAEPYVTPGNIDGPATPTPGKGGWTWYTGSAAWLQRCLFEDLLGIRSQPEGIEFEPTVPPDWVGFSVKRPWRGKLLEIHLIRSEDEGVEVKGSRGGIASLPGSFLPARILHGRGPFRIRVSYRPRS